MIFEAQSIAFACAINLAVIAIGFAIQCWRTRDAVLLDWAIGCACGALGSALSAQLGPAPDPWGMAAAKALMLLYFLCAHNGMRRLLQLRLQQAVWVLPMIVAALDIYSITFEWQPDVWPVISCYAPLLLCLTIIVKVLCDRGVMSMHALLMLIATLLLGELVLMRVAFNAGSPTSALDHVMAVNVLTTAFALPMMLGLQALYVGHMKSDLTDIADTDVLTGLRNRRRFDEMAGDEVLRCSHGRQALWLLMIDIDNFKKINDSFGHLEGDHALRQVSRVLREGVRSSDIVARYGGEEFCILLPDADESTAHATAQRLRSLVAELHVGPKLDHAVTISIGATAMDREDSCLDDLLKRADRALYLAKSGGRNQVVGFDTPRMTA
jgi:diguanylate cyclase (GGDEF)-like protein